MRRFLGILVLILSACLTAQPTLAAGPLPITYGQTVEGTLSTAQPEADYLFSATQGDTITATIAGDSGLSALVVLVDSTQKTVLTVGSNTGNGARLRYIIPNSDQYILKATATSGTGSYKLLLTLENPTPTASPFSDAPLIAPLTSAPVQADLNDNVRFRLYTLSAHQGDPISATLTVTNNIQAGLYLYSADFTEIARAEMGATLNATAPADGLYYLMVARGAAEKNAGTFTLTQINDTLLTIGLGKKVSGNITNDAPAITYTLVGASGQSILARLQRTSGDLVPYLYVVNVDTGAKLAEAADSNNDGEADLTVVLPASGNFVVIASRDGQANGTSSGGFSLSVQSPGDSAPIPPAFQGYLPIKYGDKVSGEIDNTSFAIPYYFTAQAGDMIQATMLGDKTLDPYLVLQNAGGSSIAEDDDSAGNKDALLKFTIKTAGYYAIIATRANFDKGKTAGSYTLELVTSAGVTSTPTQTANGLIPGQAQTGTIGAKVAAVFSFDSGENTSVNIDVNPSPGLDVTTLLVDSNSGQIATSASGPIRGVNLPHAGAYTIIVLRRNGPTDPANGTFTLTLQSAALVATPVPTLTASATLGSTASTAATGATAAPANSLKVIQIEYNGIATGLITDSNFVNYFSFKGSQGDVISLRMSPTPGSTLQAVLYLYVYENNQPKLIQSQPGNPDAAITKLTLPESGMYLIVAARNGLAAGHSSGTYTLALSKDG